MQFDSFIGNALGDAAFAGGRTDPAGCACPSLDATADPASVAVARACQAVGCVLGQDAQYTSIGTPNNRWNHLTLFASPTPDAADPFAIDGRFQEPEEANPAYEPGGIAFTWDFVHDLAAFNGQAGTPLPTLLWSRVNDLYPVYPNPSPALPSTFGSLKHSYLARYASTFAGFYLQWPPIPVATAGSDGVSWHSYVWQTSRPVFAVPSYVTVLTKDGGAFPIEQVGDTVRAVDSEMSPAALSLLGQVGARTADLLVGDDVVLGTRFGTTPLAAVVVQGGTSNVLGALRASGSTLDAAGCTPAAGAAGCGKLATVVSAAGDPVVRTYDALDGRLYTMNATVASTTLTSLDVAAQLAGAPVTTTVAVVGDRPQDPLAIAWNVVDGAIYVVDSVAVHPGSALRLVRINLTGRGTELWRTRQLDEVPSVFLSVSSLGEVVVSISHRHGSELLAVDRSGAAVLSAAVEGNLRGPALVGSNGITFPLARAAGGTVSDLEIRTLTRSQSLPGICGAPWLLDRIDRTMPNTLGDRCWACNYEQAHGSP
jgi:hypothetical protein